MICESSRRSDEVLSTDMIHGESRCDKNPSFIATVASFWFLKGAGDERSFRYQHNEKSYIWVPWTSLDLDSLFPPVIRKAVSLYFLTQSIKVQR